MNPSIDYQQMIDQMKIAAVTSTIFWFIVKIAFWVVVVILVSKYLAKQISKYFDYDRLAQRTAEEICKRMLIIEKQRKEAGEVEEEEDQGYTKAFEHIEVSSDA